VGSGGGGPSLSAGWRGGRVGAAISLECYMKDQGRRLKMLREMTWRDGLFAEERPAVGSGRLPCPGGVGKREKKVRMLA